MAEIEPGTHGEDSDNKRDNGDMQFAVHYAGLGPVCLFAQCVSPSHIFDVSVCGDKMTPVAKSFDLQADCTTNSTVNAP